MESWKEKWSKKIELLPPEEIEKRSFEIITQQLHEKSIFPETQNESVIKRVIHTTADFEYAKNLYFSKNVVTKAVETLRRGADIITDTQMTKAGIRKKELEKLGGQVHCFMNDETVIQQAKAKNATRAAVSMEQAAQIGKECIFAIGNAPTALIKLYELIQQRRLQPCIIIAVPVGFVNVIPAKEMILESGVDCIIAKGQKGGSTIAAAICNALLIQAVKS